MDLPTTRRYQAVPSKAGTMGRRIPVSTMLEQRLLESLEAGLKGGDSAERRQFHATRSPAWELLPKEWKGICLVALRKEEPIEDGEGGPSPIRRQRAQGRRNRRGRGNRSSNQDLLMSKDEAMSSESHGPAFRLATLLVHKSRDRDSWGDGDEAILTGLRLECTQGVHKVWEKMAQETPLLAEFAAHPVLEQEEHLGGDCAAWAENARIDPEDHQALSRFLGDELPMIIPSKAEADLRRAVAQLASGKVRLARVLTQDLKELTGAATLIPAMLAFAAGDDTALEALDLSDESISAVCNDQLHLRSMRRGVAEGWKQALESTDDDQLSAIMRKVAWLVAPMDEMDLPLQEMEKGLGILIEDGEAKTAIDGLRWHIVSALIADGRAEEASTHIVELSLDRDDVLPSVLKLIGESENDAIHDWFKKQLHRLPPASISTVIANPDLPSEIKILASSHLEVQDGDPGVQTEMLTLMLDTGDMAGLARVLMEIGSGPEDHPVETLLATHLHPATGDEKMVEWLRDARSRAHAAMKDETPEHGLSDLSFSIINMLDGARCEIEPLAERLERGSFQAFKECRRALQEGGDGIVSESSLKRLQEGIVEADLSIVERALCETLVDGLRLNRAAMMLQDSGAGGSESDLLDSVLSRPDLRMEVVLAARELVMEHDIPLPALLEWYQSTAPTSVWAIIARASVQSHDGDRLASARSWRLAADRSSFSYEQKVMLYRKALIHFAHSESWTEAVELLNAEPALHSALTRRFQLYLRVSEDASMKRQEMGTRKLLDFVRSEKKVRVENQEGEIIEETVVTYAEEELDFLFNYNAEHPNPLPSEPFQGRVRAALSSIRKDRRRSRVEDEMRYQRLMHESSQDRDLEPLITDIYELANDAAEVDAMRGLSILERAMNSGRFKPRQLSRLVYAQQGVYQNHHKEISVRYRKHLRHLQLTPLLMVDTNILIDALKERIANDLELSSDVRLDLLGSRHFHRTIINRRNEGRIRIFVPGIVVSEIMNITGDVQRLRRMFSDVMIDEQRWNDIMVKENLEKMVEEILSSFKDWSHHNVRFEQEAEEDSDDLNQFLLDHAEVYDQLTQQKSTHGEMARTALVEDDAIYPEESDLRIMLQARALANSYLDGISAVVIASRDGDFTLFSRAFEERFGFGVVKNAQQLRSWLR